MATNPPSTMALPAQAPQFGSRTADPAQAEMVFSQLRQGVSPQEFSNELLASAEQVDPQAVAKLRSALDELDVPPEVLDLLNSMVDEVLANPQNYEEIRQKYLGQGLTEDVLPEEFDPQFFAVLNVAIDQMRGEPAGPQAFANGGIAQLKPIAQAMASYGRNGDTMLAHITPAEARMLRRHGGSGTTNPVTGLPEFFLGKVFKSIGNAIKKFASSTVGKIITTVALGFLVGPAAASMLGVTSAAGVAAVSGFVGSAGSTLMGGGNLRDALKAGVTGALLAGVGTGVMQGAESFQAGSYTGPTTVSGQFERVTNALSPNAPAQLPTQAQLPEQAPLQSPSQAAPGAPDAAVAESFPVRPPSEITSRPLDKYDLWPEEYGNIEIGKAPGSQAGAPAAQQPAPGTPTAPTPPTPAVPKVPTIGEGFSRVMSGDISGGLKDIFTPGGLTPQQVMETSEFKQLVARGMPAPEALKIATGQVNPGMLRAYGPMAAAGLGIMGLAGGFKQKPVTSPYESLFTGGAGSAKDLLARNPYQYYIQNLPGVNYYNGSVLPPPKFSDGGSVGGDGPNYDPGADLLPGTQPPVTPPVADAPATQTPPITAGPTITPMPVSQIGTPAAASVEVPTAGVGGYNTYSPAAQTMYYNELNRSLLGARPPAAPPMPPGGMPPMRLPEDDIRAFPARPPAGMPPAPGGMIPPRPPLSFPSNEKLAQIEQLYRGLLGRDPDPQGLMYYANPQSNFSLDDIRRSLENTPERQEYLRRTRPTTPTLPPGGPVVGPPLPPTLPPTLPPGTPVVGPPLPPTIPPGEDIRRTIPERPQRGIAALAGGGYPRRTGQISGPGTEKSDSIPAMLSDGEFVMTAKAVRGAGNGSRRAGAKKMYALMHQLERNASRG